MCVRRCADKAVSSFRLFICLHIISVWRGTSDLSRLWPILNIDSTWMDISSTIQLINPCLNITLRKQQGKEMKTEVTTYKHSVSSPSLLAASVISITALAVLFWIHLFSTMKKTLNPHCDRFTETGKFEALSTLLFRHLFLFWTPILTILTT